MESDSRGDEVIEARVIPGVLAAGLTVRRTDGSPLAIGLSGEVVAPQIPARREAQCDPVAASEDCYAWAVPAGPLRFRIVRPPAHGTAVISDSSGTRATAVYTPAPGCSSPDSFEYTASDARGSRARLRW